MSEIKIEKGVPVPLGGRGRAKYPWRQMKVGDSFFAPATRRINPRMAEQSTGFKFATRVEGDGVRIWRVK